MFPPYCFSPEFLQMLQSMPPPPMLPLFNPRDRNDSPTQLRKLFVGGLCHETTNEHLGAYFSKWGKVIDSIVMRDTKTQNSRGFGFVTYESVFDAEMAMGARPHWLGGKRIDLKRSVPREQMDSVQAPFFFPTEPVTPGCKLSISGVTSKIHSVDSLRIYFDTFGTLDQIEIRKWGNQGFVIFERKESADACLAHNDGVHVVNDRAITVAGISAASSAADIPKMIDDCGFVDTNTEDECHNDLISSDQESDYFHKF